MSTIKAISILFAALIFFASCNDSLVGPDDPIGELPRELTQVEKKLIEADRHFSYELFRNTVAYDDEENVFISPLSITMALAMTLNGAEGETYDQMRETLRLNGMDTDEINEAFESLMKLLTTVDPKVTLKIANSIWYREGLPVKEDFLERVRSAYNASVEGLDFADPAAVDIINNWVDANTQGLIEEIIDEIPGEIVMYLINALYFKGDWLRQFDTNNTRPADFYLESGETIQVDMMSQEDRFATYFSEEVQMIELPYGDSLFSMTILLPNDRDMPINRFVEEKVSAQNLAKWRSNLSVGRDVILQLPKFELEYEITYNNILKAMGMEVPFDEWEADFSGIADVSPQNLYIDEVKHKTFIRVDEEGTEAAAVTSVGIGITSMPPSVIVDRPFVFIIHERESGTNLFMGKVKNPS
ncbi:MAG: serpin family protein [Balneolaceae bacterium]|nr:serpin family protein [Balneolaceae bacterium]